MGWFARYRHGQGFGIHSPFAYRFVTECLNERCHYYDYALLPSRQERLLYRVACYFQPAAVAAVGDADAKPALMACRKARKKAPSKADFIVAGEGALSMAELMEAIDREAVIVLFGRKCTALPELLAHMDSRDCGMCFTNQRGMVVIVPDKKLPRQDFKVRF